MAKDELSFSNCLIELYILSKITPSIPILVYNEDSEIMYIFDNGVKFNIFENENDDIVASYKLKKKYINIRFTFSANKKIPTTIEIIYFK